MSQYRYSSLSSEPNSIRLLRLMPNKEEHAPIQCQLFNYSPQETGEKTLPYEAISYVWGDPNKTLPILIDGHHFNVTVNLLAALSHLRYRSFERIIWVDAICINQEDVQERGHQIQSMAKIYGQANRVIVWLGETENDSDRALEEIRVAPGQYSMNSLNGEVVLRAILALLQRPWFRRIWIIQEVAAARNILIICGSAEIDGYAFCLGVESLKGMYKARPEIWGPIGPVTYLIRESVFRPKYQTGRSGRVSLDICPLSELIDMYHTREATVRHDKVYALLGMSSDDTSAAGLYPDYNIPWEELFQRLVKFVLCKEVSVETWSEREMAIIKSKGCILGRVSWVKSNWDGRQNVNIMFSNTWKQAECNEKPDTHWILHISAKSVHQGDLVCLLEGASKPTIIRLFKDYFAVIVIAVTLTEDMRTENRSFGPPELSQSIEFPYEFLLVWNWEVSPGKVQDCEGYDKATRLWNIALILKDLKEYKKAEERHQEAIEACIEAFGKEHLHTLTGMDNLALLYMQSQQLKEAEELFIEVIYTRKRVQGPAHPDTLNSMTKLELTYREQGDLKKAENQETMVYILNQGGDHAQITEEKAVQIAGSLDREMMRLLLERREDEVQITEKVVKAAAGNESSGQEIMRLLLERRGYEVHITEEVVKAAAGNRRSGKGVITVLLERRGDEVHITEEVVKAAVGNKWSGKGVMTLLLQRKENEVQITEEAVIQIVRRFDKAVTMLLLERRGSKTQITEEAVVQIARRFDEEVTMLLLERREDEVQITEEVVKAAAGNELSGEEVMTVLLERKRDEVQITEEVVMAAAGNRRSGKGVMTLLLERRGKEVQITEEVVKAAAGNESSGEEVMTLLLERKGDEVQITEEVVKAAAGNEKITQMLLDKGADINVQEETKKNDEIGAASDTASDFSAESSVWSATSTINSQSSLGDFYNVFQNASGKMAEVLCEDPDLRTLYLEVMTKFDKDRFAQNHDNILKRFFKDLRSEVHGHLHLRTIRFLRHPSQRKQVTEWIHKLCSPSIEPVILQSRQAFLDQKEHREEILNRFLQFQASASHDRRDVVSAETIEEEDTSTSHKEYDNIDKETSEDSEDEDKPAEFEELDSVIAFLTEGTSFEFFKANLRSLIHPPTSVQEAIQFRNINVLRKLLVKQFSRVATGRYSWIRELDEAGYTHEDIAELLFQEANDAPWIYFEPQVLDQAMVHPDDRVHAKGCVHCCFDDPPVSGQSRVLPTYLGIEKDTDITDAVQELCGLAGITPTSRDRKEWIGSVTFKEQNSVAVVSYAAFGKNVDSDCLAILHRIIVALEHFCSAAGRMQSSGLCCNAFTVLVHPVYTPNLERGEATLVELCSIKFGFAAQMLAEMRVLSTLDHMKTSNFRNVREFALRILEPLVQNFPESFRHDYLHETLHLLALAVQFLCLGFLSYNQAHVGAIQPFFLDTPQRKILLLGSHTYENQSERIVAELAELTCVGSMIEAPVLTFRMHRSSTESPPVESELRHDLLTTAEDLLDTWGPGNFIVRKGFNASPCAIKICGGIIYVPDRDVPKFHWSNALAVEDHQLDCFDPRSKIRLGTLVTVNTSCKINEKECWDNSSCAFENLGVHDDFWKHDESQIGGQAGNYILLQHNRTKHKIPGKTLKRWILEQDIEMLTQALNCLWGLQVSFCTGVTRRVPLRELIADLLPVFAKTFTQDQDKWHELKNQHGILDAFQRDDVQDWFSTLSPLLYNYVLSIIRRIIVVLQPTGIDPEGKFLLVAWSYNCPPFRCFRIPCHDKMSSWVRVLADSGDCATFAYISTNCLETERIKCRGPSPLWHNTTPLLETAIFRHNENPSKPLGPLEHKKTYFFKKMDSLLQVTVERQVQSGVVNLIVLPSSIPAEFRQRVDRMVMKKQRNRIRERQKMCDIGVEHVAVLTKYENMP
ncbi:hypothetical protein K469DRAFT_645244 [Zopfia rhizophila CBS 207.26]|uniref:Heterokaryon incompatibility domain-containing protein n=1 Tax=Zopfia rhizophila CBS 207.26 TaxID=1314779 RepID=A0A6A6DFK9_9PEZI|nr:hypothetical protein K469DRAFT_645244 [Zopfia rhizophila CBS 207.26]